MTQKEYKEKLLELENQIVELKKELDFERSKKCDYEQALIDYHRANEYLRTANENIRQNELTIDRLNQMIERYERILDRFSINSKWEINI